MFNLVSNKCNIFVNNISCQLSFNMRANNDFNEVVLNIFIFEKKTEVAQLFLICYNSYIIIHKWDIIYKKKQHIQKLSIKLFKNKKQSRDDTKCIVLQNNDTSCMFIVCKCFTYNVLTYWNTFMLQANH